MRNITNQDVGEDADAWVDWWRKNRSKSQEEWIADGFRQRGFDIAVPPTAVQTPILLAVLGNSETNKLTAIPNEMKYNAFRCLRDSGFETVAFALSNRTLSAEIGQGLLEYAKRERLSPSGNGIGILPFGRKKDKWEGMLMPPTKYRVTANVLVFGLPLLGVALLACSYRKKKESVESGPRGLTQ